MIFQIAGMCLFYHFMATESLTLRQCVLFLLMFLLYVAVICYQQWKSPSSKDGAGADLLAQKLSDEEDQAEPNDAKVSAVIEVLS